MIALRAIDTDMLPPYDIWCLAHVLFQPLEYDIFEPKWIQLAEGAAVQNAVANQRDPRHRAGADVLLGIDEFADINRQIN